MTGDDATPADLVDLALQAVRAASELIHDRRPGRLQVNQKSTATDNVTDMDLASESLIRSVIASSRPWDRIIGEESAQDSSKLATGGAELARSREANEVTWIVDPIDGTTNYLYDLPGYNVSIAAAIGDEVVAGVVADPAHGRIYSATLGGGAFCNGSPIDATTSVTPKKLTLDRALIATGFAYLPATRAKQGRVVAELLPRVRDIRRFGAAALDLCHVAAGRVDGYFEVGLAQWDVAAGALIAREAGAMVESLRGGPAMPTSVVAAKPEILEQLQELLDDLGAGTVNQPGA